MIGDCGARLVDEGHLLICNRNPRHFAKPHRATGSWMTSDGRLVTATVTWPIDPDEWNPIEDMTGVDPFVPDDYLGLGV